MLLLPIANSLHFKLTNLIVVYVGLFELRKRQYSQGELNQLGDVFSLSIQRSD